MSQLKTRRLTIKAGGRVLCQPLDLTLADGDCIALLGPNGSGKTSLLHTLIGLHPAASGSISLNEQPLTAMTRAAIARYAGLLFQHTHAVFPQTVWEYCLAGRFPHQGAFSFEQETDRQMTEHALQVMTMDALKHRCVQQLSGGEKRRADIAMLLTQSPDIYLLDEPANHLDLRHQFHVMRHFQSLAASGQHAVVMSLHDINHAQRFCNRALLLFADGEIQLGPISDILTSENLTRLYDYPVKGMTCADGIVWLPALS